MRVRARHREVEAAFVVGHDVRAVLEEHAHARDSRVLLAEVRVAAAFHHAAEQGGALVQQVSTNKHGRSGGIRCERAAAQNGLVHRAAAARAGANARHVTHFELGACRERPERDREQASVRADRRIRRGHVRDAQRSRLVAEARG